MKVIFVEDDIRLAKLIQEYLEKNSFEILLCHDGLEGEKTILDINPDIVILDLMLPGIDGMEICRRIRNKYSGPILFLTAQDDNMDEVAALELGADDYIVKPIEPRVLLAKLRAVSRRLEREMDNHHHEYVFDNIVINVFTRDVYVSNKKLDLSSNEYELLLVFAENAGKVLNRDTLSETIRGVSYDGLDRSIDITVSRLRKKLSEFSPDADIIKTVWGKGYLFVK